MRYLSLFFILLLLAAPALAFDGTQKEGPPAPYHPTAPIDVLGIRADLVFNTGGSENYVPETGGIVEAWGEYFVTVYHNDSGETLKLTEFGFPCGGPGPAQWMFWQTAGGVEDPPGPPTAPDVGGSFTPSDLDPDAMPPTNYSFVDVSGHSLIVPAGGYFAFGYENPGAGGLTMFGDVWTWAWFDKIELGTFTWEPDGYYNKAAVMQFKADFITAVFATSFGQIKRLY